MNSLLIIKAICFRTVLQFCLVPTLTHLRFTLLTTCLLGEKNFSSPNFPKKAKLKFHPKNLSNHAPQKLPKNLKQPPTNRMNHRSKKKNKPKMLKNYPLHTPKMKVLFLPTKLITMKCQLEEKNLTFQSSLMKNQNKRKNQQNQELQNQASPARLKDKFQ